MTQTAVRESGSMVLGGLRAVLARVAALKRELARDVTGSVPVGAIAVLSTLEGSGCRRVSDIAEVLRLDVSVVSRHVRVLEDHGLVTRRTDSDRRAHVLTLTEAGASTLEQVSDALSSRLGSALAAWSPADVQTLRDLLDRLQADLVLPHT